MNGDMPLGFTMALAQNTDALNNFSKLSKDEKQNFINGASNIASKTEMQGYVNSLTQGWISIAISGILKGT